MLSTTPPLDQSAHPLKTPNPKGAVHRTQCCVTTGQNTLGRNHQPEDLEAWLQSRPREDAVLIAAHAALRVFPRLVHGLPNGDREFSDAVVLRFCRAVAISRFLGASGRTGIKLSKAAFNARDQIDLLRRNDVLSLPYNRDQLNIILSSGEAVAHIAAAFAAKNAGSFSIMAGDVFEAAQIALCPEIDGEEKEHLVLAFCGSVSMDATQLEQGNEQYFLATSPIWNRSLGSWGPLGELGALSGTPKSILTDWHALRDHLRAADEGWEVWTDWYQDRLDGKPANQELELAKALIPDDIWESGPEVLNAEVARLIEKHKHSEPGAQPPSTPPPPIRPKTSQPDAPELEPASARFCSIRLTCKADYDDPAAGTAVHRLSNQIRHGFIGIVEEQPGTLFLGNARQIDHLSVELAEIAPGSVKLTLNGTLTTIAAVVTILAGLDQAAVKVDQLVDWTVEKVEMVIEEFNRNEGEDAPFVVSGFEVIGRPERDVPDDLREAEQRNRLKTLGGDQPVH